MRVFPVEEHHELYHEESYLNRIYTQNIFRIPSFRDNFIGDCLRGSEIHRQRQT